MKALCFLLTAAAATSLNEAVAAFTMTLSPLPRTFSRQVCALSSRQGCPSHAVGRKCDTKSSWRPSARSGSLVLTLSAAESMKGGTSPAEPGGLEKQTAAPGKTVAALCALGCVLGLYAFYVGTMATASPPVGARGAQSGFKAWCDFSTGASCSTVARSQYGVGLGLIKPNGPWGFLALPNSLYGIIYYVAMFFTQLPSTYAVPRARQIALILSGGALFASFYLGYLLVFVIKNLCVVCVATYVVNGALFRLSLLDYQAVLASLRTKRKSSAVSRAKGLVLSDRVARGEQDRAATADADKANIEQDKSGSQDKAKEDDEKETGDQAVEGVGEAIVAVGNEPTATAATDKTAADDEVCAGEKAKKDSSSGNETSGDGDEEKVDGKAGKR